MVSGRKAGIRRQIGVTSVEFALGALAFLLMFFSVIQFAIMGLRMSELNLAAESAAGMLSKCKSGLAASNGQSLSAIPDAVTEKLAAQLPGYPSNGTLTATWLTSNCPADFGACEVMVTISNYRPTLIAPVLLPFTESYTLKNTVVKRREAASNDAC